MRRAWGIILALVGAAAVALGAIGLAAFGVAGQMKETSSALVSGDDSHALVADILSIDAGFPGSSSLGEVTIGAEALGGRPVFIGYGTRSDVDQYLEGVAFDAVSQQGSEWQTKSVPGSGSPADPGKQSFWRGSATGFDADVRFQLPSSGQVSLVVMNRNGDAPVKARIAVGYESDLVFPLSLALVVVGAALFVVGLLLLRRRRAGSVRRTAAPSAAGAAAGSGVANGGQPAEVSGTEPAVLEPPTASPSEVPESPPQDTEVLTGQAGTQRHPSGELPAGEDAAPVEGAGTDAAQGEPYPQDWFREDSTKR